MDEEAFIAKGQLYKHAIVSLHSYHHAIMNLLDATMQKKNKDHNLDDKIHTYINRIKESISEIQTIQQKKISTNVDFKPLKNMVSYKINIQFETTKILIEEDAPLPPWIQNL